MEHGRADDRQTAGGEVRMRCRMTQQHRLGRDEMSGKRPKAYAGGGRRTEEGVRQTSIGWQNGVKEGQL